MDYSKKESPKEKTPSGSARFSGPELGAASVSQSSILNCHAQFFAGPAERYAGAGR